MRYSTKPSRYYKDKHKRVAHVSKKKSGKRIVREAPPKQQNKIVVTQELVRDPTTGKAKYKDVYNVKKVDDKKIDKNILYIPKRAPEKERTYLRAVKPQFESVKRKYDNPDRYGTLEAYKKSRLLQIAKQNYGLSDKLSKHLDKADIIRYINKRYRLGDDLDEKKYLPSSIQLMKAEPVRTGEFEFFASRDPNDPSASHLRYKTSGLTKGGHKTKVFEFDARPTGATSTAEIYRQINQEIEDKIKIESSKKGLEAHAITDLRNMPRFGTHRSMDKDLYAEFQQKTADKGDLIREITTHINLPYEEKLKLHRLNEDQIGRLYKKMYKYSLKTDEEKFVKGFRFEKLQFQPNAPNYAKAPQLTDLTGKPNVVSRQTIPRAINLFKDYTPQSVQQEEHLMDLEHRQGMSGKDIDKLMASDKKLTESDKKKAMKMEGLERRLDALEFLQKLSK